MYRRPIAGSSLTQDNLIGRAARLHYVGPVVDADLLHMDRSIPAVEVGEHLVGGGIYGHQRDADRKRNHPEPKRQRHPERVRAAPALPRTAFSVVPVTLPHRSALRPNRTPAVGERRPPPDRARLPLMPDRKSTRLNSSH